jgi:hypothetical protein
MVSRIAAATVAGGIAFFFLGFLIYGVILDPLVMKPNMNEFAGLTKEVPAWAPLVAANFVSALLLAYIFDVWAGIRTFAGGLKAGAIIFFLMSLSFQLMFIAFWNLSKNLLPNVMDVVGSTVLGAICGGIIAMVLGMMSKEVRSAQA